MTPGATDGQSAAPQFDREIRRVRRPSQASGRTEILDLIVPQLALRVTEHGAKKLLGADPHQRPAGSGRLLGDATALSCSPRRAIWRGEVLQHAKRGVDHLDQRKAERRGAADEAARAAQKLEWTGVRERFIEEHAKPTQRRWKETERILKRYIDPHWSGRLVTEIDRDDVLELVNRVRKSSGLHMANRTLAPPTRKLFNWALLQPRMLKVTPIVPGMALKGEKPRERVLSDLELRRLWQAADTRAYPFGPDVKLLDADRPAARRDRFLALGRDRRGRGPDRVRRRALRDRQPPRRASVGARARPPSMRSRGMASTSSPTNGRKPINSATYVKALVTEALAEPLPDWRLHDIRRSLRTNLSKIGIPTDHAERVIGHVIGGVRGVHDRYSYLPEKRHALEAWASRLSLIVGLASAENVVSLRTG